MGEDKDELIVPEELDSVTKQSSKSYNNSEPGDSQVETIKTDILAHLCICCFASNDQASKVLLLIYEKRLDELEKGFIGAMILSREAWLND